MEEDFPSYEELVKKTYGVHATHVYPKKAIITPGSLCIVKTHNDNSPELSREEVLKLMEVTPKRRFTLHWSLGGVAESHDFEAENGEIRKHDFTSCPYAIMEPFENLLPESYGGQDQD